jgi:putative addiction module component (TIGR02574 family)
MLPNTLAELLKLSASARVEIAMALWESLSEIERAEQLPLAVEQEAELDRRLAEHIAKPTSAVPWDDVCKKLRPN